MKIPSNINFKNLCDEFYLAKDTKYIKHISMFLEVFFATILNDEVETYTVICPEDTNIVLPFILWLNKNGFNIRLELIGDKSSFLDNIINNTDIAIKIYINWS